MRFKDITGQKFGRLTVIKRIYPNTKFRLINWLCKCDCGKEKIVKGTDLRSGNTKSCGCLKLELARGPYGRSSLRALIKSYKRHAKDRSLKFELTEGQFSEITKKDCHYCGAEPNNISKRKRSYGHYVYNGIDRVDNNKGYILNNVVPCCKICNHYKSDLSSSKFLSWIEKVYNKMFVKGGLKCQLNYTKLSRTGGKV